MGCFLEELLVPIFPKFYYKLPKFYYKLISKKGTGPVQCCRPGPLEHASYVFKLNKSAMVKQDCFKYFLFWVKVKKLLRVKRPLTFISWGRSFTSILYKIATYRHGPSKSGKFAAICRFSPQAAWHDTISKFSFLALPETKI